MKNILLIGLFVLVLISTAIIITLSIFYSKCRNKFQKKVDLQNYVNNKIPNINTDPLKYILEILKIKHDDKNELWLEFGVAQGKSINYISKFTENTVYGFDSFEGLPEKWREGYPMGKFSTNGKMPHVHQNVKLIKGLFQQTLETFLDHHKEKSVKFIHIDCDLYSSTAYICKTIWSKNMIKESCIIVFDELVNYPGFDGPTGELRALYEFMNYANNIKMKWIGMNGKVGNGRPQVAIELIIVDNK